jgi:hypothetical protein
MFKLSIDDRLSSWAQHRSNLEESETPFSDVWEFWKDAPYVPYNNKIDPFHQRSWPSPWEIIVDNHYDDFTKALMIGWSLKLTNRFKESKIEIRTVVDNTRHIMYNIVCVNEEIVINYSDNGPISGKNMPDSFLIENLIELNRSR